MSAWHRLIALIGVAACITSACSSATPAARFPTPTPQAPTPEPDIDPNGVISLDRNFYLVLDGSGSMGSSECAGGYRTRGEAIKAVTAAFVDRSVPPDVNLGLYIFDGAGSTERAPLAKDNRTAIMREITRLSVGGNTPLNRAIRFATDALVQQRRAQLGYGEFYIVVATDGMADDGPDDAADGVRHAQKHRIPIITIGFCLKQDHALAKSSLSYRSANDPAALLAALESTQGEATYVDAPAGGR